MALKVWNHGEHPSSADLNNNFAEVESRAAIAKLFAPALAQPAGLIWGYQAGRIRNAAGAIIEVAAGQIALSADATNYIEIDNTGAVSKITTGFTLAKKPLCVVVTDSGSVLSSVDKRVDFDFTGGAAAVSNASQDTAGITKLSAAPADPESPIAVGTMQNVGGVLSGNVLNPGFAVNMATQDELEAAIATRAAATHSHTSADISDFVAAARDAMEYSTGAPVADLTALRAVVAGDRQDKQTRLVESNGSLYRFDAEGSGTDDNDGVIAPGSGTGRWFKTAAGGSGNADTLDGQDGAHYLARAHHTGTQEIATVDGLQDALDALETTGDDFTDYPAIETPAPPATDHVIVHARASGTSPTRLLELCALLPSGESAVIASYVS